MIGGSTSSRVSAGFSGTMFTSFDPRLALDAADLRPPAPRQPRNHAHLQRERSPRAGRRSSNDSRENMIAVPRRVDPLSAEGGGGLADPLHAPLQNPRTDRIGQRRLGRRPAVVRLAFLDPELAMVALATAHGIYFAACSASFGAENNRDSDYLKDRRALQTPACSLPIPRAGYHTGPWQVLEHLFHSHHKPGLSEGSRGELLFDCYCTAPAVPS